MNRLLIALAAAGAMLAVSSNLSNAEDFNNTTSPAMANASADFGSSSEHKVSALRKVASEAAILRYRVALRLTAAQERYWPAAASALRALSRQAQLDEAVVRRYAPAMKPLIASLNDEQKQVAMGLAQQAGLAQYASMF